MTTERPRYNEEMRKRKQELKYESEAADDYDDDTGQKRLSWKDEYRRADRQSKKQRHRDSDQEDY